MRSVSTGEITPLRARAVQRGSTACPVASGSRGPGWGVVGVEARSQGQLETFRRAIVKHPTESDTA
jgi:hypothetical protein